MKISQPGPFARFLPLAIGVALVLPPFVASAAPGDLDNSFSNDGRVATGFEDDNTYVKDVGLQENGKIVLVGGSGDKFAFARYRPNGRLDKSFSDDGRATVGVPGTSNVNLSGLKVLKSGDILATGLGNFGGTADNNVILIRVKSNGRRDRDFGNDGIVATNFGGDDRGQEVLTHGGMIYVVGSGGGTGSYDGIIARYHSNGKLDTKTDSDPNKHWSSDGKVNIDLDGRAEGLLALRFLRQGKVLAAGSSSSGKGTVFLLAKLNRKGNLDEGFAMDGLKIAPFSKQNQVIQDIEITSNGFVTGSSIGTFPARDFLLRRYTKKGGVDESFDNDGIVQTDTGDNDGFDGLTVQENGKVLATGVYGQSDTKVLLVRYDKDGSPSASFGNAGIVKTEFPGALAGNYIEGVDVVVQDDGRIVVGGLGEHADFRGVFLVARYKD